MFALYEAGLPTELDPETLATVGETDLNGAVKGFFSAHFHAVPSRRALYNFSIKRGRQNMLHLYELPTGGALRCIGSLPLPRSSAMVHDFIATEKHLVFFIPPVRMRILPVLLGTKAPLDALEWRPQDGTTVLVVPIDSPHQARRFEVDAFFQYHFMNAYESAGTIVVDFVRVADFGKAFASHTTEQRAHKTATEGRLFRAIVQPERGSVELEQRAQVPCEFPQVAPSVQGRQHRFGYVLAAREGEPQTRVAKIEVATGHIESTDVGEHCFPSEPVFVPREGAESEDDGYLLTLAYDAEADRSYVAVLDARQLDRGPLARATFDHHVPRPLHGTWHGGPQPI
ncbi:MAG: carotenoid oxygenase family protein [Burkholderiales bacterium]